ncbi:MAG: PQQ-binding-like beta-propeller repeat protein [Candidatus Aegiribacteria sp.]|nr:PQQ-binding-like beta-propeller repeat protein [Candidatus Aegiribacteria sp.]
MTIGTILTVILISVTNLTITEPVDGEIYDGDWLPLRAIVENENEIPDSVHYSLNSGPFVPIPRLNTDWPTYMQNNLNYGYSLSPAPLTNDVLWTAPMCDTMHVFENPIVVGGVVYHLGVQSLFALEAGTGSEIWNYAVGPHDDPPTYHDGRLYLASDSLYCIDAATGDRVWAVIAGDVNGGTPCIASGIIACATSSFITNKTEVFGLGLADGNVVWQREITGVIGNCIGEWNGIFYIGTYQGQLSALDAMTGNVIWSHTITEGGYWDTSPTIVDGKIYIGGMDGSVHRFDALTGALEWETSLGSIPVEPTPAVFGDWIICGSIGTPGCLVALDRENGSIQWSIPSSIHGSPAVAGDIVFWGGMDAPYDLVFAASAWTGEILWEYDPNAGPWGLQCTPSITDGVMYFGCTDGNLYAFGTGLKYTYREDFFYAEVGSNELIVTSFDEGAAVAADTINFTVTQTGINLEPSHQLDLCATPNPFHCSASISFELSDSEFTKIEIFDLAGRSVSMLVNHKMTAGTQTILWNGTNQNGDLVSTGLYMCRIQSGAITETIGLCLLR